MAPTDDELDEEICGTLFSWLLLRSRMIPIALAWLGVVASLLIVTVQPLQRGGIIVADANWFSSVTWLIWFPLLVFEVALALWLIVKGVYVPTAR